MSNPISTSIAVLAVLMLTNNGRVATPLSLAWSSSDASVATVDPATGIVTPVTPGSATITASYTVLSNDGTTVLSGSAVGVCNVTSQGDNLVAVVDFQPVPPSPSPTPSA